jgi:DNA-binding NarL/FixJ family response regulator
LLVDDHAVVREGYRRLLERSGTIKVASEAANAEEAYRRFCEDCPDVVVMDISLPDASGIEALRRILPRKPEARILMFSMHEEAIFATRAIAAGARGYITKASAPEILVEAVEAVASGRRYLSDDVAEAISLESAADPAQILSEREFEVLELLARGETVNSIATKLGVTPKTVANHQSAVRQKIGADNGAQLVHAALRLGLIPVARSCSRAC